MEYVLHAIGRPVYGRRNLLSPVVLSFRHLHDHFVPTHRNNYHPHVLGHRALALFSALLVTVKIFTIAALTLGPAIPAYSSAITSANIISLTNASRTDYGLESLTENQVLHKAAQAKADDMLAKGYFSHNTPDGKTPWDFITAAGYTYITAGENLAVNFTEAENVEQAWMNSPGHKANIVNKNFEEIGIGISQGQFEGHEAIFVVQMFGTPAEQKIALSDTPTKVQTTSVPAPEITTPKAAVKASETAQVLPEALTLKNGQIEASGDDIRVSVEASATATKVLAHFGPAAVMLQPKANGVWEGALSLKTLATGNLEVKLEAFDMNGKTATLQLAEFANNTASAYQVAGAVTENKFVSFLGRTFDPKAAESRFYSLFIVGMLSALAIAIGVKKHIQHLSLITNSSVVAMLACILWMTG